MLLTTHVKMKWVQNKSKVHYEKKGYNFTFFGDEFIVPIEDLPKASNVPVTVICDYCNEELPKRYSNYRASREKSPIKKEACNKCHPLKTKEGNKLLYGVEHYTQRPGEAKKIGDRTRLSTEYVKKEFKMRNLILLTEKYENATQLLEYTCTKHLEKGIMKGSWSNIINQVGCGYCGNEEGGKKQRTEYHKIQEMFEEKNFILLTNEDEYVNTKTTVEYYCKFHPEIKLINTPDAIRYVQGCKECFLDRNRGENSSNWNGGINTLKDFLRFYTKEWKRDSMQFWNSKCVITGKSAEVIHHLYNFSFLMEIVFERLKLDIRPHAIDYTYEEKLLLTEMIKKIHYEYGYGVALTREIHVLFHKEYGWENNTPYQFNEFKTKMKSLYLKS